MSREKMEVSKAMFMAGLIFAILASSLMPIVIARSELIKGSEGDKGDKGDTGAKATTDRAKRLPIVATSPSGNPVSGTDSQCLEESGDNTSGFAVTSDDGNLFNTTVRNGICAVQAYDPTGCAVDLDQFRHWSQSALNTQYLVLVMASGSMCTLPDPYCDGWSHPFYPTLHVGDLLIVHRANASEIRAAPYPDGDVIVFQQLYGDELFIHRAIEKREQDGNIYFITKGDGNPAPDQPIPASNVVGKVVLRIPWIGHIILFMRSTISKTLSS